MVLFLLTGLGKFAENVATARWLVQCFRASFTSGRISNEATFEGKPDCDLHIHLGDRSTVVHLEMLTKWLTVIGPYLWLSDGVRTVRNRIRIGFSQKVGGKMWEDVFQVVSYRVMNCSVVQSRWLVLMTTNEERHWTFSMSLSKFYHEWMVHCRFP